MARKLIINGGAIRPTGPLVVTWGWFTSGPTPNYQWSTVIYIWCANGGSPTVGQQRLSGHANGGPTTHLSLVYRWANGGSTEAYRWLAIVGPTAHISLVYRWPTVGPTVASHRWANRGPPVASHRWPNGGPTEAHRWLATVGPTVGQQRPTGRLATVGPTVGQQRPTGGYSHRWANRGSLDTPTVGHRWLPPLAHQYTYRWPTVGPTVASHRWANRGPPVASQRWANRGPPVAIATGGPTEARWTNPQWATGGCHRWPISTRTVGPPLAHQSNAIWDSPGTPLFGSIKHPFQGFSFFCEQACVPKKIQERFPLRGSYSPKVQHFSFI